VIRRTRIAQQSEKRKVEQREWQRVAEAALRRDSHTCQAANLVPDLACKGRLDPHHIATKRRAPELRLSLSNLVTLCRAHHDWTHAHPYEAERLGLLDEGH
jgi:5-methylcytosine-specific restriction endonuclease McrA